MFASPGEPLSRLNVKPLAGKSESLAEATNVKVPPRAMEESTISVSVGETFTSLTVTVNVLLSLKGGRPLSVARTVI